MTIQIAHEAGAYRCYGTTDGRTRVYQGCAHATPRDAIEHSDRLDPAVRAGAPAASGPQHLPPGAADRRPADILAAHVADVIRACDPDRGAA